MSKKTIWIPISENDLEDNLKGVVYNNQTFEWNFPTEENSFEEITVIFMSFDEFEQRNK